MGHFNILKTINFNFSIFLFCIALSPGCSCNKGKGIATVKCDDVEHLESNAGQLNVAHWGLGQIKYIISDSNCLVQDLGVNIDTNVLKQNTTVVDRGSLLEVSLSKELDVSVQGDFQNKVAIKADLQSKLKSKAIFSAYDYAQNRLNNLLELLNKDENIKSAFRSAVKRFSTTKFFIVNTVLTGDSLIFSIDKNKSASAQVKIPSFGIDFNVSLDCSAAYKKKGGPGTLLMFQYQFLEWDEVSGKIVPSKKPMKIGKCSILSLYDAPTTAVPA